MKRFLMVKQLVQTSLALLVALPACDPRPNKPEKISPKDIVWEECPLYTDEPSGPKAECATVSVPLDWDSPQGATIDLFVQRLRGPQSDNSKHIWILHGGPDHSADYAGLQELFTYEMPQSDVYMLDHRGTGRSTRLDCGKDVDLDDPHLPAADITKCIADLQQKWGTGLEHFTTTAAARDVGYLMDLVDKDNSAARFVYGLSYGSLWAQRFLQVYPDSLEGVIIEGIANPARGYNAANELAQAPFNNLLSHCAQDTFCSGKLGTDPGQILDDLLEAATSQDHCSALFGPLAEAGFSPAEAVKSLLWLLEEEGWDGRVMIPAVIYRLSRCSDQDMQAIAYLLEVLERLGSEEQRFASLALFYHIHMTTFWTSSYPACTELPGVDYSAYRIFAPVPETLCRLQGLGWPVAPADEHSGATAETDTPMLMLNGAMDVQTPALGAQEVASHFQEEHQHFFELPRTGHSPLTDSFVEQDDYPCGMQLALAFLQDPRAELDTSCIEDIQDIDFTGAAPNQLDVGLSLAKFLFDTEDLYE
jgi:pimeloyl-ACP methyl ester carboxylesterase